MTTRFGGNFSMIEMVFEQIFSSNILMSEVFSMGVTKFTWFWKDRVPNFSMITAVL